MELVRKWGKPEPKYLLLKLIWSISAFILSTGLMAYSAVILLKIKAKFESTIVLILGIPMSVVFVFVGTIIVTIILNRLFYHIITPFYEWVSSLFSNENIS